MEENNKPMDGVQNSEENNNASVSAAENAEARPNENPAAEQSADSGSAKNKKKKSATQEIREWVVSLAVALLVVFIIRTFLFQIIRVDGHSMDTTLADNERLFVTILDVKLNGVDRNDIVICHYPNRGGTNFVKRVVAVPGDVIYRENGVTHVLYSATEADGSVTQVDEMLDERYAAYFPLGSSDDYAAYTLGEDEYFVCGDNRYNSHDSRDWNDSDSSGDVGPIGKDMIVGKVRNVIWPLNFMRSVE